MWVKPPWKNIDASTASHTFLPGTPGGASGRPTLHASVSPPLIP